MVTFEMPLAEVIYDLFDKLKSMTKGYGTMDYEVIGFRSEDLVRLEQRYKSNDPYLRRELETLLNHWNGEIDKTQSDLISGNNKPGATSLNISDYQ
jgi:hypothetical protein